VPEGEENPIVATLHVAHGVERGLQVAGISLPAALAYVAGFNHAIYDTLPLVVAAAVVAAAVRSKLSREPIGYFVLGAIVLLAAGFVTDLAESSVSEALEKLDKTVGHQFPGSVYQAYFDHYNFWIFLIAIACGAAVGWSLARDPKPG
jgi:hypothetical protein